MGADHGGLSAPSPLAGEGRGEGSSNVTALAPRGEIAGSTALKAAPEQRLSPAQALEQQVVADPRTYAKALAAERRAEAKAKGYEGEACGTCGNFTLVRNGTCLKCDTCGNHGVQLMRTPMISRATTRIVGSRIPATVTGTRRPQEIG